MGKGSVYFVASGISYFATQTSSSFVHI